MQVHFGLTLEVRAGQIVCLLGGNASGKSTTMKIILGLLRPRAGHVRLDGADITGLPTPSVIRRGIGSVPEARRLFPAMTVRENLLMGAFARRDRAAVAEDLERMLELFPRVRARLTARAGTLSGGEQQMVAMARALMGRPRLLCMDEPTMGLSPLYVDRVLELVGPSAASGVTVFMVEQNASLALRIAHCVCAADRADRAARVRRRSSCATRGSATPIWVARRTTDGSAQAIGSALAIDQTFGRLGLLVEAFDKMRLGPLPATAIGVPKARWSRMVRPPG